MYMDNVNVRTHTHEWNACTWRIFYFRILVDTDIVEVFDINGHIVPSQMNPVWTAADSMETEYFELLFYVDLQPTELRVFTLKPSTQTKVETQDEQ